MRVVIIGVLVIVVVSVGAYLFAASLPAEVQASRTRTINAPVDRVFALVTNVADQPRWRQDVASVTVADDGRRWTEQTKQGIAISFEETGRVPLQRFEIAFSSPQGFTGVWVGEFAATAQGQTEVTFTETIRTESPIGRLMQRIFAPPGAHIELYLRDLEAAAAA